jgi:membrane protein implicated in regulation of membrane protease activity
MGDFKLTPDLEQRIKEIDKKIIQVAIMDFPGAILLGLGLYAVFAADGDAFLPILNNQAVVYTILAVGAAIMLWGFLRTVGLIQERARLQKEQELLDKLSD